MVAALGAQVAMFQWGWGEHLFGITPAQTISFLPIIMLAIIFGLSSDYEVFVVSRIKEEYTKNGDARRAVQRGTALSARVVTAAALIMFSIFVAFMFTNDPTIKAIGFSFAVGVFLDGHIFEVRTEGERRKSFDHFVRIFENSEAVAGVRERRGRGREAAG